MKKNITDKQFKEFHHLTDEEFSEIQNFFVRNFDDDFENVKRLLTETTTKSPLTISDIKESLEIIIENKGMQDSLYILIHFLQTCSYKGIKGKDVARFYDMLYNIGPPTEEWICQ